MKHLHPLVFGLALAASSFTASTVRADAGGDGHRAEPPAATGKLVKVDEKTDLTWLARARADYPLSSCVVSGDKFDGADMGKAQDFVYRQPGKPDRLVRFCCKDCEKDFNKEPAKYLKAIDAAAAKTTSGTGSAAPDQTAP